MYVRDEGRLDNACITRIIERAEGVLSDAGVARRSSTRMTILLEELLLRYQERFGDEASFTFEVDKYFGTLRFRIIVAGEQFDALAAAGMDDDGSHEHFDFLTVLMQNDVGPHAYGYRRGRNVVTLSMRLRRRSPSWANPMLVATIAAVLAFVVLMHLAPDLAATLTEGCVTPIVSLLMGVLSAITGPLLSLSLISGICALGDMSTLRNTGRHAMLRITAWVLVMTLVSVAVSWAVFDIAEGANDIAFDPNELFRLLLGSIPQNLFSPFVEGNALQIAVESIFVGVCLLALGEATATVKRLVMELNALAFKMMHIFSGTLPLLVGLSVFKVLMTTDMSSMAGMGAMVAVDFLVMGLLGVAILVWVRLSLHVPPFAFLKKLSPSLGICLATGNSTSAMNEFFRISKERLGIASSVVDFWVPLGHALFTPSVIVPMVVGMYGVADMEGDDFGLTRIAVRPCSSSSSPSRHRRYPAASPPPIRSSSASWGFRWTPSASSWLPSVFVCNPAVAFGDFVRYAEICLFAKSENALDEERFRSAS